MNFGKRFKKVSKKNLTVNMYTMNYYNGKINTNSHNNKIPKEGSQFIFLSVVLIDSVFRTGKCYCHQVL